MKWTVIVYLPKPGVTAFTLYCQPGWLYYFKISLLGWLLRVFILHCHAKIAAADSGWCKMSSDRISGNMIDTQPHNSYIVGPTSMGKLEFINCLHLGYIPQSLRQTPISCCTITFFWFFNATRNRIKLTLTVVIFYLPTITYHKSICLLEMQRDKYIHDKF